MSVNRHSSPLNFDPCIMSQRFGAMTNTSTRSKSAGDHEERIQPLRRVETLIERDKPNIALFHGSPFDLVSDRLEG